MLSIPDSMAGLKPDEVLSVPAISTPDGTISKLHLVSCLQPYLIAKQKLEIIKMFKIHTALR